MPKKLQKPRIVITDHRPTMGWTWLSILWPGRERKKTVFISAGALHYLEADELCALILHEMGHHDPKNRADIPGGWMLTDMALFSMIFQMGAHMGFNIKIIINIFIWSRSLLAWMIYWLQGRSYQKVEHFCDLYSVQHIGKNAIINTLLKMGEEAELSEVVLARAARQLLYEKDIEAEDLYDVFEKARPYGRIFHDNLFKHASEIVKEIQDDLNPNYKKGKKPNGILNEFLTQRPSKQKKRIRWRRFDKNKNGRLDGVEIAELYDFLKQNPENPLFLSEQERNPTTHPSFRDRILMLIEMQAGKNSVGY
ncbi:MAG: hypothetical protein EHM45_10810 [Desulfobacteraceae bacterium]|nr:MAG: hypothetical protein EHM45_10810 [Desulfobacteraceae bacterium]